MNPVMPVCAATDAASYTTWWDTIKMSACHLLMRTNEARPEVLLTGKRFYEMCTELSEQESRAARQAKR